MTTTNRRKVRSAKHFSLTQACLAAAAAAVCCLTMPPILTAAAAAPSVRSVPASASPLQRPRSVIVDNHQPLVDEHIALGSSARHHLTFVSPDSLSEYVVDSIADEVAYLRKNLPTFAEVCAALEGPDVDSEDALLRCLKKVYYPSEPIYTGRSGVRSPATGIAVGAGGSGSVLSALRIGGPAAADGGEGASAASVATDGAAESGDAKASGAGEKEAGGVGAGAALLGEDEPLSEVDEGILMDTNGWMPMRLANGSTYLCRMPRAGDGLLMENDEGAIVPKQKKKSKAEKVPSSSAAEAGEEENAESDADAESSKASLKKTTAKGGKTARSSAERQKGASADDANGNPNAKKTPAPIRKGEAKSKAALAKKGARSAAKSEVEEDDDVFASESDAKKDKDGEGSVDEEEEEDDATQTFEELQPGQRLPRHLRLELSKRLRGSRCAIKAAGWWNYEVCWERHVRQFHQEQGKTTSSHYLGQGPLRRVEDGTRASDVFFNVHSVRGPYLSATFFNGSTCDVTGEPRIAEIRLFCDPSGGAVGSGASAAAAAAAGLSEQLASSINLHASTVEISEPETCKYLVWMGSPKACLKQTQKKKGPILGLRCRIVDDL